MVESAEGVACDVQQHVCGESGVNAAVGGRHDQRRMTRNEQKTVKNRKEKQTS
jgi:hypothetical protein